MDLTSLASVVLVVLVAGAVLAFVKKLMKLGCALAIVGVVVLASLGFAWFA